MRFLTRLVILLAVFFGGVYVGGQKLIKFGPPIEVPRIDLQQIEAQLKPKPQTVSLLLDYGSRQGRTIAVYHDVTITSSSTVLSVLEQVAASNNFTIRSKDFAGSLGAFIEAIDGESNNPKADEWCWPWQDEFYPIPGILRPWLPPR